MEAHLELRLQELELKLQELELRLQELELRLQELELRLQELILEVKRPKRCHPEGCRQLLAHYPSLVLLKCQDRMALTISLNPYLVAPFPVGL